MKIDDFSIIAYIQATLQECIINFVNQKKFNAIKRLQIKVFQHTYFYHSTSNILYLLLRNECQKDTCKLYELPFFRLLFLFLTYIRIFFDISKNVYYRNIKMILIVTSFQPDLFRNYTYIIIWHDKNIANISDLLSKLKIRCNFSSARNLRHLLKTLLDLIAHLSSHKTHYRPYCFCRIRCILYTYTY